MSDPTNSTLSNLILTSIPQSTWNWKTVGGVQLVAADVAVLDKSLLSTTLLTNRQLRKNQSNSMMANMARADSLFAFVLFLTGYWNTNAGLCPFGELGCRFHIVSAMSVVKLIRVGFPLTSDKILKPISMGNGRECIVICLFSIGMKQLFPPIIYLVCTTFMNVTSTLCFILIQFVTVVKATGLVMCVV
ncbi:hypothetical protein LSAT2_026781, partial [Lamellibrachia satsuma]